MRIEDHILDLARIWPEFLGGMAGYFAHHFKDKAYHAIVQSGSRLLRGVYR